MTSLQDRVVAHLEAVLGQPARVTRGTELIAGEAAPCSIATFRDQPVEGAFTLVSVGLSDRPLEGPEGEKVRQELLLCGWDEDLDDRLYRCLFDVALATREAGETADPGAVIELAEPLSDHGDLRRAFFYPPTYHPDALATFALPRGTVGDGEIEIVWLLPITAQEALLVESEGPEAFEAYLAREDPDLLDLSRE